VPDGAHYKGFGVDPVAGGGVFFEDRSALAQQLGGPLPEAAVARAGGSHAEKQGVQGLRHGALQEG
jgi:hypothetical protein